MRRLLAPLLLIAALAAACSSDTAENDAVPGTSDEASTAQGWEQFVIAVDLDQELVPPAPTVDEVTVEYLMKILHPNRFLPTPANQQTWNAETTVMTQLRARCYNEAGFPYFGVDEALADPFAALLADTDPFSREYAETYGLVSQSSQTTVPEAADRQAAQEAFRSELSAEEKIIFDDLRLSCQEATASMATTSHLQAALVVLASHSININTAITNDERFSSFEQAWVACVAEQGLAYESLKQIHQDAEVTTAGAVVSYDCNGNEQWAITEVVFDDVLGPLVAEHLDEIKAEIAAG